MPGYTAIGGARSNLGILGHADRTRATRTRRLLAPLSLEERKKHAIRHPEERCQFRKLLTDPEQPISMISRPRNACCWGASGAAIRQCDDRPVDRLCPYLMNESYDCFELDAAFPEFSAVGARSLLPKMKTRLSFEVKTEPSALKHILQVGFARVEGEPEQIRSGTLDDSTKLLESVVFTSSGDLMCSNGHLEIVAPGAVAGGLRFRRENWCSGAPSWLSGDCLMSRIMMEADMRLGRIAISMGDWSHDPLVIAVPSLTEEAADEKQWFPYISLTAVGQSARIIDFHSSFQV